MAKNDLVKVFDGLIQMPIFETDERFVLDQERDPPVNLDIVTLQMSLSRLLSEVL